ncbi:TetR/AcrR family transcriptional regulator [Thalassotalea euphylliae]|uniref:TetR/AcrR family transcriptional regulator n=1 Tax=Thalassotalea euphylliae TaxID=1655234 RepID=UPI00364238F1
MAPAPKYSPQEQEELILNAAAECIAETSVLDFTMSAVSKAAGLSMGSIYKHVQCKEDIIFALASRMFSRHQEVFSQVLASELTAPEKIVALTLMDPKKIEVYPFDAHLEGFATNELIISRTSQRWTERMMQSHEKCETIFNKFMHQAAFSGELTLNGNIDEMVEEINLGSWALMVGYQCIDRVFQMRNISEGTDSLHEPVATDALRVKSLMRLLDGYNWRKPIDNEGVERAAAKLVELGLR